jgi:nucleotide-binding universal stress UspA family protein
MAKRILVPLDRSELAETIMPLVAGLARGAGATVRLLHVVPVPENVVSKEGRVVAYADQEMERLEARRSPGTGRARPGDAGPRRRSSSAAGGPA